ncbi:methyltransferase domain-containing protein [Candidatus Parcubacteria bacterium]|jgi:predicted SAM-dependent methyltransferase|nr:methyltransferase domain-containing protein [Candidatus Parcubacteria bacterium]
MRRAKLFLIQKLPRHQLIRFSFIFSNIFSIFLKGNKHYCPICETGFSRFFSYGSKNRNNSLCPGCLSLERHRLLWFYLKNETNFFRDKLKVLHLAPEQCFYRKFKKMSNLEYVTGDLNSPLAEVKLDIHKMPFTDNLFDVVFANHVLEHVEDDVKAMKEVYRVLKPGGWAILQVPIDTKRDRTLEDKNIVEPIDRERLFGQYDHLRLYGRDYIDRLASAGFNVQAKRYCEQLNEATVTKSNLMQSEIIYIAKKK